MTHSNDEPNEPLPLVAPCNGVAPGEPLVWLRQGWRDLRRAPGVSLSLGLAVAAVSWLISAAAWYVGSWALLGLIVIVPWLGHATWHGYRRIPDAGAWPERRIP